jgi:hypothetical protein
MTMPRLTLSSAAAPSIITGSASRAQIRARSSSTSSPATSSVARELVAADPGDRVLDPHAVGEAAGDRAQHGVAGGVTVGVAERLEVVDVDHHHRHLATVTAPAGEGLDEPVVAYRRLVDGQLPGDEARARSAGGLEDAMYDTFTFPPTRRGRPPVKMAFHARP